MHATVRIYEGIEKPAELIGEVTATLLPGMKEIAGFVDYYIVDVGESGGRMVTISVFESAEAAEESNRLAAEWVQGHPGLVPPARSVEAGEVIVGG